ncbi:MAG: hypothetical protein QOC68_779 [Solirubrobacteraceae bacterium]|nr:hypothetical protein [Solirubrobacteraceae bacterium]
MGRTLSLGWPSEALPGSERAGWGGFWRHAVELSIAGPPSDGSMPGYGDHPPGAERQTLPGTRLGDGRSLRTRIGWPQMMAARR